MNIKICWKQIRYFGGFLHAIVLLQTAHVEVTGAAETTYQFNDSHTVASDCKLYRQDYYNLQAIIAAGFKINPVRAVRFRAWRQMCRSILR